jgi:hypothetical protein
MESALLGLVLDFSILITAERRKITPEKSGDHCPDWREQAARGVNLRSVTSSSEPVLQNPGTRGTGNRRDFRRIPGLAGVRL